MSQSPDRLFAQPLEQVPDFVFNEDVVRVFPDMIKRSVPGYPTIVENLGVLAARFAQPHTALYDLGASLGAVTQSLRRHVRSDGCRVIAVDNSAAMVERCRQYLTAQDSMFQELLPVQVLEADILALPFEPASVVAMNFTLQFIAPDQRLELLGRIRQALLPGGALILSEKLRFADEQQQHLLNELHLDFKRANGYSELEIAQKRSAIENVMRPDTLEAHQQRLRAAGFSKVVPWFQCLNFASLTSPAMIDLSPLVRRLAGTPLASWSQGLQAQLEAKLEKGHGDLDRWRGALDALPALQPSEIDLVNGLRLDCDCDDATRAQMRQALMGLSPWRKGPFDLFGVHVDTEWRSDWKWSRVGPHLDLKGKRVLDVGCGNGYYQWRMLGAGADMVIGVDPNWLFFCQFQAVQQYLPELPAWHLPFALEDLPANLEGFDTVFSMGVFYHRRSPIEHLLALKDCLVKGGELVLETLVVEGDAQQVLVPEDRYAQMRNVWFLPSVPALERWLRRAGFSDVRCVDVSVTSVEEQRSTEWMRYQSLSDFLDPNDHSKTIEGLPAPRRATLLARK